MRVDHTGTGGRLEGDRRFRVHLVARWAERIVSHPVLVAAVRRVLGSDNILVWSSDLCIKPPVSQGRSGSLHGWILISMLLCHSLILKPGY